MVLDCEPASPRNPLGALAQMMGERGISVDHSTLCRWVQRDAPEMEERLRWQGRADRQLPRP